MTTNTMNCPNEHGPMELKTINKATVFRGENIEYNIEVFVCKQCALEVGTIEQAAAVQNTIADAYRNKIGLLTGNEIKKNRLKFGWSQKKLAKKAGVGIASIKRWENGIIQTKSMNSALKAAFQGYSVGNLYNGNRKFSIPRVKLVLKQFESVLGFPFLIEGDKLLFDAKYSWYADFLAYEKTGKSLTGSTYAKLPHGPQLNNYKELVDLIREADPSEAESLSDEDKMIIGRVAATFPTKRKVIDASHREKVWKDKGAGMLIPYSDASKLSEIAL